jgi:hypothetical protein
MVARFKDADGSGRLDVNGQSSSVTYQINAVEDGADGFAVKVGLSAPRDWLLKQGFQTEATLVRENGTSVSVQHDGELDVDDALSVVLEFVDRGLKSSSDVEQKYPELKLASA